MAELDFAKVQDMNFPRQPGPVTIAIHADALEDQENAANMIQRYLEGRYANIERYRRYDETILTAYPFAVND